MRMPKPERIALLNPEQRHVYDNWVKEERVFNSCLDEVLSAMESGDRQAAEQALEKFQAAIPPVCEHGLDIASSCEACEDIERILYPEFCDQYGNMLSDEEIFDIVDKEMDHELN